jgi:hypothetical protein
MSGLPDIGSFNAQVACSRLACGRLEGEYAPYGPDPSRRALRALLRMRVKVQTLLAPEGASRCRAETSGLLDRSASRIHGLC